MGWGHNICVHLNLRVYWALLEAVKAVSDMHWMLHSARGAVACGTVLEWMEAQ